MNTYYLNNKEQKYFKNIIKEDQILSSVRFYDSYRNCAIMSNWIMQACTNHKMTFIDIESLLRGKDCYSYLLGLPANTLPKYQKAVNFLSPTHEVMPYFLWICVNGKEEAIKTLSEFGITEEQNLVNLKQTGFICQEE
jgi:hypothetical protein